MEDHNVILELSWMDTSNYLVQTVEGGGYLWHDDRSYVTETAAIARAEDLISVRGVSKVRIVDISNND